MIEDVQNAVAAGKIVTISQSMIHYKGWTGTGYVLLDPKTGAGAYLIGGGMDGAVLIATLVFVLGPLFALYFGGVLAFVFVAYSSYEGMKIFFKKVNAMLDRGCSDEAIEDYGYSTASVQATLIASGIALSFVSNSLFGNIGGQQGALAKIGIWGMVSAVINKMLNAPQKTQCGLV